VREAVKEENAEKMGQGGEKLASSGKVADFE